MKRSGIIILISGDGGAQESTVALNVKESLGDQIYE